MDTFKANDGTVIAIFEDGAMIIKRKGTKKNRVLEHKNYKEAKAVALELLKILNNRKVK